MVQIYPLKKKSVSGECSTVWDCWDSFKNKFGIYFNNSPDRKIRRERREGKWGGSGVRRGCGISQNTIELAWLD